MARSGWSSTNFLRYNSGLLTAPPLSISVWANTSVTGTNQRIVGLFNSASSGTINLFMLGVASTNIPSFQTCDGAGAKVASSSGAISANTWFHLCGITGSPTDRSVYLNGGNKGTNTTSAIPSGINRFSVGLIDNTSAVQPFAPGGTGIIAELGLWNIVLSDADILALSNGVSPLVVHPEALVGYWPLLGNNSPENNLKSNSATMSIVGSLSKAAHPRILMPRRRLVA